MSCQLYNSLFFRRFALILCFRRCQRMFAFFRCSLRKRLRAFLFRPAVILCLQNLGAAFDLPLNPELLFRVRIKTAASPQEC